MWAQRMSGVLVVSGIIMPLFAESASGAVAHFTDGTGTTSVDQYEGIAGDGWATPWQPLVSVANDAAAATVTNASPLSGGGNYLAVSMTGNTAANLHRVAVRRTFSSIASEHTISWKFRLDDASIATFAGGNDGLLFADRIDLSSGTGGGLTWGIKAQGDFNGKRFFAFNGNGGGAATNVDTGMALVAGLEYSMAVTVHPGTDWASTSYDVSIFDGTTTALLPGMKFRNTTVFTSGGNLQFTAESDGLGEPRAFSLDAVVIAPTAVPEPGSIVALTTAAGLLLSRRRARHAGR